MGCHTPREAFDHLSDALERRDWPEAVATLDPDDVITFRDRELAILTDRTAMVLEARREGRPMQGFTSNAILDPARLAQFGSEPQEAFPSAATLSELAALSPGDFLVACMNAGVAAAKRLQSRARERGWISTDEKPVPSKCRVLGVLPEGERLAHVLYRWDGPKHDWYPTRVHVRTARLIDNYWHVCLDHELQMRLSPILAFHAFDESVGQEER